VFTRAHTWTGADDSPVSLRFALRNVRNESDLDEGRVEQFAGTLESGGRHESHSPFRCCVHVVTGCSVDSHPHYQAIYRLVKMTYIPTELRSEIILNCTVSYL
jgi:hypothetical protein